MTDSPETGSAGADRLAKVIARAGLCSRRDAELWIREGRVTVNGRKVVTPAFNVAEGDKITVDGTPLAARQGTRVWLYHKPPGLVVTEKDPEGRETIFEALEKHGLPRVVTIGRLDINTEGLLLLTNDGGLKRVLELPATGWLRKYRVRAFGSITQEKLDALKTGMEVDGIRYGPIEAVLERQQGANVWMEVALREGKNREVKNVLGALGLEVNRLIRISYGPFQLGDLPVGAVESVKARVLRDQLGRRLAEESGADFDSDGPEAPSATNPRRRAAAPGAPEPRQRRNRDTDAPRFRFTDRADQPARESREESVRDETRPRRDRPGGRFDRQAPRKGGAAPRGREEAPGREPRTVHFDDGRDSESFVPRASKARERFDRDDQPARSFGLPGAARPPRAPRPTGDRPPRPEGDRPRKPYGDRADRPAGDRPRKPFGDRPPRPEGDRPRKPYGDRPDRPAGDRPRKPFGDRPPRPEGDRPRKPYGDRPDRPAGDRPRKPFGDRPPRPEGDRPRKPYGDRPVKPAGARPSKPFGQRPAGGPGKPAGPRPPRKPRP